MLNKVRGIGSPSLDVFLPFRHHREVFLIFKGYKSPKYCEDSYHPNFIMKRFHLENCAKATQEKEVVTKGPVKKLHE